MSIILHFLIDCRWLMKNPNNGKKVYAINSNYLLKIRRGKIKISPFSHVAKLEGVEVKNCYTQPKPLEDKKEWKGDGIQKFVYSFYSNQLLIFFNIPTRKFQKLSVEIPTEMRHILKEIFNL